MGAAVERELKFANVMVDDLRRKLTEIGGECLSREGLEENVLFDCRDQTLRESGEVLRLRADRKGHHLTWKGPASFQGGVKEREEIEVELSGPDDYDALRLVFHQLGYEPKRRYQKKREEWSVDGCIVALDFTPMGQFAEVEGDTAGQLAQRLGLDPGDAERRTYLQLWESYRRENPGAPHDMLFAEESS